MSYKRLPQVGKAWQRRPQLLLAGGKASRGGLLHRIKVEEEMLNEALEPQYAEYSERTSRLVPSVW